MELLVGMTQSKASQASISPATAVDLLKAGNKRFMNKTPANRDLHSQVGDTSTGQYPFASCLLYTSPSPRDLSTSRMPSSA